MEVKTDTYPLTTGNFFLERWGHEEDRKPGGPWRARLHRVEIFTYFYVKENTYFEFNTKELCARADKIARRKSTREVRVKNKGYITMGYLMPRSEFEDIWEEYELPTDKV